MAYKSRSLKSNLLTYIFLLLLVAGIFLVALIATKRSTDLRSRAQALPSSKVIINGVNYELQGKVLQSEAEFNQLKNSTVNTFTSSDDKRIKEYFEKNERTNLKPVISNQKQLQQSNPTTTRFAVTPILFVPKNYWNSSRLRQYQLSITETFQLLRRWYSGTAEADTGYTFDLNPVVTYKAPQNFEYYKCPNHQSPCNNYDGVWGSIQDQLYTAGYQSWTYGKIYFVFVPGAGGWAGGNCAGNECLSQWPHATTAGTTGFAIMGDWALDAISGFRNNDCWANLGSACGKNQQQGAVGHELGHTFGLGHPDRYGTIMSYWWYFPNISLVNDGLDKEKDVLWSSRFIKSVPCTNEAVVDYLYMPERVVTNQPFYSYFSVRNYGFCTWQPDGKHSFNLVVEDVWGNNKNPVLDEIIAPAQWYWVYVPMKAPSKVGAYASIWKMYFNNETFGPHTGRGRVFVLRDPNSEVK